MKEPRDRSSQIKFIYKGCQPKGSTGKPIKSTLLPYKQKQTTIMFRTPKLKQKVKEDTTEDLIKSSRIYKELQMELQLMIAKHKAQIDRLKQTENNKLKDIQQLQSSVDNHKNDIENISNRVQQTKQQLLEQQQQYYYLTNQNEEYQDNQNEEYDQEGEYNQEQQENQQLQNNEYLNGLQYQLKKDIDQLDVEMKNHEDYN